MILGLISSHRAGELLVACMRRLDEDDEEDLQGASNGGRMLL